MRFIAFIALLLLITSCAAEDSQTTDRLSELAEEVIEFDHDARFSALESVQILKITDEDVEPLFGRLNQLRVLRDGSLIAFDAADVRIHHFDAAGNYLSSFGSSGEGPGEFSNSAVLQVHNDTVYVFERLAYKIDVFSLTNSQWTHTETIALENIEDDMPWRLQKVDDAHIWMQFRHSETNRKGASISVYHITRLDRNNTDKYETWLVTLPDLNLMFEDLGGFIAAYPVPFSHRPIVDITPDGDIILARTDAFSFLRKPIDRTNPAILTTLPIDNIRLTIEEKQNVTGFADRIQSLVDLHMPDYRPAVITQIITDDDNGFWAGYEIEEKTENRWLYIDASGNITEETYLPGSFTPHVFKNATFFGLEPDSNGINAISAYRLD